MFGFKQGFYYKALLAAIILSFFSNCNYEKKAFSQNKSGTQLRRPPATVEKAWLARHKYDADRRLLIPTYSGARWGSILEYTEDQNLVYRDWWERDVKMEDLNPKPNTALVPFSQIESGNISEADESMDSNNETDPLKSLDQTTDTPTQNLEDGNLIPPSDFPFTPASSGGNVGEEPMLNPDSLPQDIDPFAPLP